ncbi:MAG TPA: hypothetical protein VHF26_05760, partial [Trebonia sp.]|nr:hypothetical protein [Trebonia sp.]
MPTTLRNRLAAALAVTVLAAAAQALGSRAHSSALASPAPSRSQSATVAEEAPGNAAQRAAVRYWTPARMAAVAQADQGLPATADMQAAGQPGAWHELVHPRRLAR